jgi:hypothetical protein
MGGAPDKATCIKSNNKIKCQIDNIEYDCIDNVSYDPLSYQCDYASAEEYQCHPNAQYICSAQKKTASNPLLDQIRNQSSAQGLKKVLQPPTKPKSGTGMQDIFESGLGKIRRAVSPTKDDEDDDAEWPNQQGGSAQRKKKKSTTRNALLAFAKSCASRKK